MAKIAEITIMMDCGGYIKTYIPCKGIKDLRKKLAWTARRGWF